MKLLILGGTRFVGRHIAAEALARGHRVTLLNRGLTAPHLFPEAEHLPADRDRELPRKNRWDAAIDVNGYASEAVARAASWLENSFYAFVSSVSAYRQPFPPGIDESAPLEDNPENPYGWAKARCEEALAPGSLILRPGVLVGPHDFKERLTWWVERLRGGAVLEAPRQGRVQLLDARDLACFVLDQVERRQGGAYNVTGPARPLREVLLTCARAAGAGELRFVEGPLDAPLCEGADWFHSVSHRKALAAGLRYRPLEESLSDP
ncbi:MAG: hypothetical protein AB1758_19700 [Candidatus Eremiobacterota bacterium]